LNCPGNIAQLTGIEWQVWRTVHKNEGFLRLMNGSENHYSLECSVLGKIRDKAFLKPGSSLGDMLKTWVVSQSEVVILLHWCSNKGYPILVNQNFRISLKDIRYMHQSSLIRYRAVIYWVKQNPWCLNNPSVQLWCARRTQLTPNKNN
jgi:hypothetical protein